MNLQRAKRKRRRSVVVFAALLLVVVAVNLGWLPKSWDWVEWPALAAALLWVSLDYAYATGWIDCHKQAQARIDRMTDVMHGAGIDYGEVTWDDMQEELRREGRG